MTTIDQSNLPAPKSYTKLIIVLVGVVGCICIVVVGVLLGLGLKGKLAIPGLTTSVPTQVPVIIPSITPIPPFINTPVPQPTNAPIPTVAPPVTVAPPQSISSIVDALRSVADGNGVSAAASYDPRKSGIHPIVFYSGDADIVDEWNAELPDAWRGQNVSQTELVAVLINHEVVVDRARYTAKGMGIFFLNRIRTDTEVILREAKTGTIVATVTFPGGDPPTLKSGYDKIITAVYGTLVPYGAVEAFLKQYIEK
jgi:hypothetical protein